MVALGVWLWGCCVVPVILQESLEDIGRVQTQDPGSKHNPNIRAGLMF